MLRSFFRNKKLIIYAVILIILNTLMILSCNLLEYFNKLYDNKINNNELIRSIVLIGINGQDSYDNSNISEENQEIITNVKHVEKTIVEFGSVYRIIVDDFKNINQVQENLLKLGFNTQLATDIQTTIDEYEFISSLVKVNIFILAFWDIITLISLWSFIIKDQEEEISILRKLGYSKQRINIMILIRVFIFIVTSYIISFILSHFISNIYDGIPVLLNRIGISSYGFYELIYNTKYSMLMRNYIEYKVLIGNTISILILYILSFKKINRNIICK
jgi:hypothetical protein